MGALTVHVVRANNKTLREKILLAFIVKRSIIKKLEADHLQLSSHNMVGGLLGDNFVRLLAM